MPTGSRRSPGKSPSGEYATGTGRGSNASRSVVPGVTGQFLRHLPVVASVVFVVSLVEALLILPAHLAHMKVKHYSSDTHNVFIRFQRFFSEGLHHVVDNYYAPFLEKCVKRRYLTIALFLAALILSEDPTLGPVATAFGEIYQYLIEGDAGAMEKKTYHDWDVRPRLRSVKGVSEINSWGGFERQYHVVVSPGALLKFDLTLDDIEQRSPGLHFCANFRGGPGVCDCLDSALTVSDRILAGLKRD